MFVCTLRIKVLRVVLVSLLITDGRETVSSRCGWGSGPSGDRSGTKVFSDFLFQTAEFCNKAWGKKVNIPRSGLGGKLCPASPVLEEPRVVVTERIGLIL